MLPLVVLHKMQVTCEFLKDDYFLSARIFLQTTSGEEMTVIMLPTLVPRSVAKEIATLFSKHQ